MALERDDRHELDELNRPPRRIHAVSGNMGEDGGERADGRMGEPTTAEILLNEVRDMKKLLSEAVVPQLATLRVQVDAHQRDLDVLKAWRDGLPDKAQAHEAQRFQMTWQTVGGILGMLTFLAYMIGPHIRLQ